MAIRHINRRVKRHKAIGCVSCERAKTKDDRRQRKLALREAKRDH